ncbi:DEAD/DEAH box helicase [Shewanella canadensis]|uniref:DEAD/DEAH box helicase n=1 Tax=Shewanella canadensis TaxID=271096 RepID=A0A431WTL2_9GAMM|nr:DEAD/DEAH box helicase [Shewanella canadensis]RTR38886.1 DEAD/DEAH box helicase [Shewanella canadensis]
MVQLEAYFSQSAIFHGMQLLLAGTLVKSEHSGLIISAEFKSDDLNAVNSQNNTQSSSKKALSKSSARSISSIYATLDWSAGPVVKSSLSHCTCQNEEDKACKHLAAIAIEHIAKQHPITPYASDKKRPDTAKRLLRTELNQRFDPYPNMARHRIIYLLSENQDGLHLSVHKGYLSKTGIYSIKNDLGLDVFMKSVLPKFVTQADRYLLDKLSILIEQCSEKDKVKQREAVSVNLSALTGLDFIRHLVSTQRCFWETCSNPALKIEQHYHQDFVDPAPFIEIDVDSYLDLASMSLILTSAPFSMPDINLDAEFDWQPQLRVTRHHVEFPWDDMHALSLDLANFSLFNGEVVYSLSEVFDYAQEVPHCLNLAAEWNIQLSDLPLLTSMFESPVWQSFPLGSRLLPSVLSEQMIALYRLSLAGWCIEFDMKNRFSIVKAQRWYGDVAQDPGSKNWFDLEIGVEVNGQKINLLPYLVKAIRLGLVDNIEDKDTILMELDSGERLSLPVDRVKQILAVLVELYEARPLSDTETLTLPMHQVTRLAELSSQLKGQQKQWHWQGTTWLNNKAQQLYSFLDSQAHSDFFVPQPDGLNAKLREYQQQGLNWLQFLQNQSFAGILADDMGLGKTIQTLASILFDKESGRLTKPCLVVAPTSLLANWLHEAQTFTPALNALLWSGPRRHKLASQIEATDLLITSYGTLQQDSQFWADKHFHLIVLDEAQTIKNVRSRIAKVVASLSSTHKLCLTGTPLENHLGELWSLFNFLMPGFLGTYAQFQRLYQFPIEKEQDDERRLALVKRISPFMLRRMKSDVATELPEKTIINEYISLTQEQGDLYETIRLTMSEEVQKAVMLSGIKRNRLAISNALLKLRQVCCHPQLLKLSHSHISQTEGVTASNDENDNSDATVSFTQGSVEQGLTEFATSSGKLNWLADKLPSMLAEGRRILIFSSFTSMLTLIGELLEQLAVTYVELTGKSRDRASLVKRFQQHEVPVFLISLKAGGAGLNLTAADVVIHMDPWWNPAAEQQASDRAHRIGQDKSVFVYKLICKDTVEERIQLLQESKQSLAQSIYQQESASVTDMSGDDWLELLKPITMDES